MKIQSILTYIVNLIIKKPWQDRMSILRINVDVLAHIFGYLEFATVIKILSTNRRTKNILIKYWKDNNPINGGKWDYGRNLLNHISKISACGIFGGAVRDYVSYNFLKKPSHIHDIDIMVLDLELVTNLNNDYHNQEKIIQKYYKLPNSFCVKKKPVNYIKYCGDYKSIKYVFELSHKYFNNFLPLTDIVILGGAVYNGSMNPIGCDFTVNSLVYPSNTMLYHCQTSIHNICDIETFISCLSNFRVGYQYISDQFRPKSYVTKKSICHHPFETKIQEIYKDIASRNLRPIGTNNVDNISIHRWFKMGLKCYNIDANIFSKILEKQNELYDKYFLPMEMQHYKLLQMEYEMNTLDLEYSIVDTKLPNNGNRNITKKCHKVTIKKCRSKLKNQNKLIRFANFSKQFIREKEIMFTNYSIIHEKKLNIFHEITQLYERLSIPFNI